jgi:hypothetical protein
MRCHRPLSRLVGVVVVLCVLLSGSPALTQLVPRVAAGEDGCGCSSSCPCRSGAGHRCTCRGAQAGLALEQTCECGLRAKEGALPGAPNDWFHVQETAFHVSFRSVPVAPEHGGLPVWHLIELRLHPS